MKVTTKDDINLLLKWACNSQVTGPQHFYNNNDQIFCTVITFIVVQDSKT